MNRLIAAGLLVVALVLAACSGSNGGNTTPAGSTDPNAIQISAKDLAFSTDKLSAPAGKAFKIAFNNQEGAPHNVAIYSDSSFGTKVFGQDPFSGPKVVTYDVPPLTAGTYYFRCDVHTNMKGTVEVK